MKLLNPHKIQVMQCIRNTDYPYSLQIHKLYKAIPDPKAARDGYVRIIDESGEDYLFPATYFIQDKQRTSPRKTPLVKA